MFSRILSVFLVAFAIGLGLFFVSIWNRPGDPVGEEGQFCDRVEAQSVAGDSGTVVTSYNTVCGVFGGSSAVYVHIHKAGQEMSPSTLVFRYFNVPDAMPPKIQWVGHSSVEITVREVVQITEQTTRIGSINIIYKIGHEEFPRKNKIDGVRP